MVMDELRQRLAVARKAVHKGGREDVEVIRIAVVEHGPDHLHLVLSGGFQHTEQRGEVVAARSFHLGPAQSIPDGANVEAAQELVVRRGPQVVLGERGQIQAQPGAIDMAGRFKARQEKGIE